MRQSLGTTVLGQYYKIDYKTTIFFPSVPALFINNNEPEEKIQFNKILHLKLVLVFTYDLQIIVDKMQLMLQNI